MHSNTSSNKIFQHDVNMTLRRQSGTMITCMIVMLFMIPYAAAGIPGRSIFNILMQWESEFQLISPRFTILVYFLTCAVGCLLGLMQFAFLRDPRREDVFFSIPLKREKLFHSRFLVSLIGLVLSIALPLTISLILNLAAYGGSAALIRSYLCILAGLMLQGLIAFLLTSIACILAGTMTEIVLYSIMLVLGFTSMIYGINQILYHVVWGNTQPDTILLHVSNGPEMLTMLDAWNPMTFYLRQTISCAAPYPGTEPEYGCIRLIIWGAIAVALWFLARKALAVRPSEQAGRKSCRIQVTRIVIFLSEFLLFALLFALLDSSNRIFAVVVALLGDFILYMIWQQTFLHQHPGAWIMASRCITMLVAVVVVFVITFGAGTHRKVKVTQDETVYSSVTQESTSSEEAPVSSGGLEQSSEGQ